MVSIVVPALNEELTIERFISWCQEGLAKCEGGGEIIIVDSSTDRTPELAEAMGARVLRVPKRGLGQAYIDAIPEIKGDYVILGDCDCTYDFREIDKFVEKLDEGYEFVMGTRMKGYIEDGAMPKLHRYFGTPLTTWILNRIYGSHYSDIHCGMRAMTLDALKKIDLESTSWEYASEMVLKAAKLKLKTAEVPIRFYKDQEGRVSVHKRAGWFSPWAAGWINLKVMFEYNPQFFLNIPGKLCILLGMIFSLLVIGGTQLQISALSMFSINWMLLAVLLIIMGNSSYQLAVLSEIYYGYDKEKSERWRQQLTYNRGVLSGGALMLVGIIILIAFLIKYINDGFQLQQAELLPLFGVLFTIVGFQIFVFTLMVRMMYKHRGGKNAG